MKRGLWRHTHTAMREVLRPATTLRTAASVHFALAAQRDAQHRAGAATADARSAQRNPALEREGGIAGRWTEHHAADRDRALMVPFPIERTGGAGAALRVAGESTFIMLTAALLCVVVELPPIGRITNLWPLLRC